MSEVERGEGLEKGHAEKDSRSRNSKGMDKIDNSKKEETEGKEIEEEMRKREQKKSVDNINREEKRNFG